MRMYISLKPTEASRLSELAERERRHPKDQAAYLIARGLDAIESKSADRSNLKTTEPVR